MADTLATKLSELEALAQSPNATVAQIARDNLEKLRIESEMGDSPVSVALQELTRILEEQTTGTGGGGAGGNVNAEEVRKIVKSTLATDGVVDFNSLSEGLKKAIKSGKGKAGTITIETPIGKFKAANEEIEKLETKLFQNLISDSLARNNIYLFGSAGTGKTFMAGELAKYFGYELVTLTCNQYTSPLDIVGGQTIEGYQMGKLEIAWGNKKPDGSKVNGAVLLLDELPKLDPNTAGILNDALAKVKNVKVFTPDKDTPVQELLARGDHIELPNGDLMQVPTIENGKSQKIAMRNIIIVATGNTKLNEVDADYVANFQQDLSLQDRFVGSVYEVFNDYEFEKNVVMRDFLFIWNYMIKLREKINELAYNNMAFVSLRIMLSLKWTHKVALEVKSGDIKQSGLESAKTVIDGVESFLSLFNKSQQQKLKEETDYDAFVTNAVLHMELPINEQNTEEDIKEADALLKKWKESRPTTV